MDLANAVIPLFAKKIINGSIHNASIPRFLGTAFFVNRSGRIATCAHVVSELDENEKLITIGGETTYGSEITEVRIHKNYDFASGVVEGSSYEPMPIHPNKVMIGDDAIAFGYIADGIISGELIIRKRLFKGHIVSVMHGYSERNQAASTCELSFPAHAGFSGAPILSNSHNLYAGGDFRHHYVAGMLYGNIESRIQLDRIEETTGNTTHIETYNKVIEMGLAHTARDILTFLSDLGVDDVTLDVPM